MNKLFIYLLLFSFIVTAQQEGTLDPVFGTDGIVTTDIYDSFTDIAYDVGIQTDGKIVVGGYTRLNSTDDFTVIRYNNDGTLDQMFGTNGMQITDVGTGTDQTRAVAIQPDGKIILAGYSIISGGVDFTIVRYNSDGTLDDTFGNDGKQTTDIGEGLDFAYDLTVQDDGKIVVVGSANMGATGNDFAIVRYNSNGSLDNTFGTDGKKTTDFAGKSDYCYSIAIQSDGKIIVAGLADTSATDTKYNLALARYNNDGSIDDTFGIAGKVITTISEGNDQANSVVIQSDGKIVAAGNATVGENSQFAVVRYSSTGILDETFGTDGIQTTDVSGNDYYNSASSVAIQSDGKIILAGTCRIGGNNIADQDFALVRYTKDGTPDAIFGTGGTQTTIVGDGSDICNSMAIQDDGKIVLVGGALEGTNSKVALARYTGTLTDLENDNTAPDKFDLTQNYPNPFNPTTTIKFTLAKSATTTLKIYNLLGEEIKTLFKGEAKAGQSYSLTFNASGFPSGLYLARLVSGPNVKTRKLLLIK